MQLRLLVRRESFLGKRMRHLHFGLEDEKIAERKSLEGAMVTPHLPCAGLLDRRDFLRIGGGLGLASFLSPRLVQAAPSQPHRGLGSARSCIFIYLLGGPP